MTQGEPISITLPASYWVAQTAILSDFIERAVLPKIDDIRNSGQSVEDLPASEVTAMAAPLISLLKIVKTLHQSGYVKDEAMHHVNTMVGKLKGHSAFKNDSWAIRKE